MKGTKFNIVSRFEDVDPSSAVVSNGYYTVILDYIRDFDADKAEGILDFSMLVITCKSKTSKDMPLPLIDRQRNMMVDMRNVADVIRGGRVDKLTENIKIAEESARELLSIIDKLFDE